MKEWRTAKGLTQTEMAKALESHAPNVIPEFNKKLPQRTLSSWEEGTLPRSQWLKIIEDFTKNKVTASSFVCGNP